MKLVQYPIMFWKGVLMCQRRRTFIIVIEQSSSMILVNVLRSYIVPVIHAFVSKLSHQPIEEFAVTCQLISWDSYECVFGSFQKLGGAGSSNIQGNISISGNE